MKDKNESKELNLIKQLKEELNRTYAEFNRLEDEYAKLREEHDKLSFNHNNCISALRHEFERHLETQAKLAEQVKLNEELQARLAIIKDIVKDDYSAFRNDCIKMHEHYKQYDCN